MFVVIRVPDTDDVRDFRVRQSFAGADYYITNWHTIGSTGSFTYAYSRHNLFSGYTVHIQKANNVTTTHFRGRIDADGTEVDPSSFSGTLGAGDTDVQTALETIDDFVLGGSSTQSVVAFKCILDGCCSGVVRCRHAHSGMRGRATDKFRADSPSRTPAPPILTDRVVIPENGIYELVVSVYADQPECQRTHHSAHLVHRRDRRHRNRSGR